MGLHVTLTEQEISTLRNLATRIQAATTRLQGPPRHPRDHAQSVRDWAAANLTPAPGSRTDIRLIHDAYTRRTGIRMRNQRFGVALPGTRQRSNGTTYVLDVVLVPSDKTTP